jgi:hypothetical protein
MQYIIQPLVSSEWDIITLGLLAGEIHELSCVVRFIANSRLTITLKCGIPYSIPLHRLLYIYDSPPAPLMY